MTVSIIIAVKTWQGNLEECLRRCLDLDYPDFEIIVLPDLDEGKHPAFPNVKVIPTGAVSPAEKRDMGIAQARGDVIAFIDDDAYPESNWLKNAMKNFQDEQVAAVGGPAITPPDVDLRRKASGVIYSSRLTTDSFVYRYIPAQRRLVDDYPACNLLVRRSILQKAGGFNTNFWPGEDTKLCLAITKELGKQIVYDPEVVVYHHRRRVFKSHLKQIKSYALHRGYFVKRYPETSRKPVYFVPSLFVLALLIGLILSFFYEFIEVAYFSSLLIYLAIVLIGDIEGVLKIYKDDTGLHKLRLIGLVFVSTVLTHLTYGIYFIKGLFSQKLKEE